MRKIVLSGLFSIVILLIGSFAMFNGKTFAAQWLSTRPRGVAIGDFNNDGVNEIAFAIMDAGTVDVYDRFGVLIYEWAGLVQPQGVAIGDYDNDGLNEVAFAEWGFGALGNVFVYKWQPPPFHPILVYQWTGLAYATGVAIGDYDTDGLNELAFTEITLNPYAGRVSVWKPNPPTSPYLMWKWEGLGDPSGVAIGDYNHDAMNELAFTEHDAGNLSVYQWQPSSPPALIHQWTGLKYPSAVASGDYDNDGLDELAYTEAPSGTEVSQATIYDWYLSPLLLKIVQDTNADGSSRVPWGVAIGDYNDDGYKDLAFTEWNGGKVIVYRWGDLGGLVSGIPTYFAYDDKVDGIDLALFIQCYKKLAPANAMYLADIGGGFPSPQFFAFDGNVNGYDLALFIQCYRGNGP